MERCYDNKHLYASFLYYQQADASIMSFRTCLTVGVIFCSALFLPMVVSEIPKSTERQEKLRKSWFETRFPVDKDARKLDQFIRDVYDPSPSSTDYIGPRSDFPMLDRRKEIRVLSKFELQQFREGLNEMKNTPADSDQSEVSEYDLIVSKHEITRAPAAHFGCGFTLWHRIFLNGFERVLQRHKPGLMLPYFDSRLDSRLPEPSHSVLWSEDLVGTNNGVVTTGLGAGWKVYPATCKIEDDYRLQRSVEPDMGDLLYGDDIRRKFLETPKSFRDLTTPFNTSDFEMSHSMIHVYVGGQMTMLSCSPNDPCFWLHHCFVDYMLDELLRNPDFNKTYPVGPDVYGNPVPQPHIKGAPLFPFIGYNLTDVSHEHFSNVDYAYDHSPGDIECTKDSQCKSEFLWCNPPQCVSKVRNGGFCGTFPARCCHCTAGQKARKTADKFCSCQ